MNKTGFEIILALANSTGNQILTFTTQYRPVHSPPASCLST